MSRSTELDGQGFCVDDLAAFLLGDGWPQPARADPAFHRALATSLDAMDLDIDPETARVAFVRAAHMAGMHVLPDDMADMRKAG